MLSDSLFAAFDQHALVVSQKRKRKQEEVAGKSLVETFNQRQQEAEQAKGTEEEIGAPLPTDKYDGDRRLRTMRTLLAIVDDRGFERSSQQVEFHEAFINAASRILYREDWALSKPDILKANGWDKSHSEVLISTPRRFGKTFRCARRAAQTKRRPVTLVLRPQRGHLRGRHRPLLSARGGRLLTRPARFPKASGTCQRVIF